MISIIIPCYNSQDYLEECLNSIIKQSYSDWEAICINDGSIDNTESILKKYSGIDNRIKYYTQPNQGVSAARNLALEYANGEYICFVDSDDTIEAHYLMELYSMIQHSDGLAICDFTRKMESIKSECNYNLLTSNEFISKVIYDNKFRPQICCMLFNASIIKENDLHFFIGCARGEDREFFMKYVIYINRIQYTGNQLYHYRINTNSAMSSFNYKSLTSLDASVRLYEYYKKNNHIHTSDLKISFDYAILKFLILSILYKKPLLYDKIKMDYNVSKSIKNLCSHPMPLVKITAYTFLFSEKLFIAFLTIICYFYRLCKY